MVVQCSLLTYIHEKNSLATVLARVFEKELENDLPGQPSRAIPSHEALFGVLQACQDQTSSYHWRHLILPTAAALGIPEDHAFSAIPAIILQGAVQMFPLVQSLPDDRMTLIDVGAHNGACSLVVWAHHVLGLTIMVKRPGPRNELAENQFGIGKVHIVLDLRDLSWDGDRTSSVEIRLPSITLMSVTDGETLIALKSRSEDDGMNIDATYRRIAAGFGRKMLQSVCGAHRAQHALVHELTMLAVAFAAIIYEQLFAKPRSAFSDGASVPTDRSCDSSGNALGKDTRRDSSTDHETRNEIEHLKLLMPQQNLIKAAQFLFDNSDLSKSSIKGHVSLYSGQPLNAELRTPDAISLILKQASSDTLPEPEWEDMFETVRYLSVVTLAFAFVKDLDCCSDFPLSHSLKVLSGHILIARLNEWDGKSIIWIPEDTWFLVLAQLLVGHKAATDPRSTCLVSDHGWSIFLSTFGDPDPSFADAGYVVIKRGVPCRNGVWKHSILDGPLAGFGQGWKICQTAGAVESLRCANDVIKDRPSCGDRYGSFLVNLHYTTKKSSLTGLSPFSDPDIALDLYRSNKGEYETRKSGYRELFAALWGVQRTQSCQHKSSPIPLPLSCASVSEFGDIHFADLTEHGRVIVCLTAHNASARWRTLLAIHMAASVKYGSIENVLLRGEDCCFQCAINQTLVRPGYWFLVL